MNSIEKLLNIQEKNNSILCVGLDTVFNKLPNHLQAMPRGILDFNKKIIDVTKDLVSSYKINFAFYEQYGIDGFEFIKQTINYIPKDILIIADVKRGDIGNTSTAYAKAVFEHFGCDAITVTPYMGEDSVAPFLEYKNKLTFVLALTSNKGSNDFQKLLVDGKPLYKHVIEKSLTWTESDNLGFVVGATNPEELSGIREIIPNQPILIPGVGTQGGSISETLQNNKKGIALINVSRDIIYTSDEHNYEIKVREKAEFYKNEFNKYR